MPLHSGRFCRLASLGGVALVTFVTFFPPRFARRRCSRHSRLVLFCVFFPIGLIGLIGLIMPIGLIAPGFLRERLMGSLGAAARRGSPLRGSNPFVCLPGGSRRCAALNPRLIRGRRFAAFFLPRFARRHFFSIESIESIFSIFRRAKLRLSRRRPRRRAGSRCCPASHRPFRTFTMLESTKDTKGTNEVNGTNRQWQE